MEKEFMTSEEVTALYSKEGDVDMPKELIEFGLDNAGIKPHNIDGKRCYLRTEVMGELPTFLRAANKAREKFDAEPTLQTLHERLLMVEAAVKATALIQSLESRVRS